MSGTRLAAATLVVFVAVALLAARRSGSVDDPTPPPSVAASVLSGGDAGAATVTPPDLGPAPELVDLDGWLQTGATGPDDFDGQVRIVQFWTFGCSNCRATLPHLRDLYDRHHDDGLEIIGVHAPEFDHERDRDAIAEAARELGVTWPIALDTEKVNFRSWQPGRRNFWPRTYVLDGDGRIRFDHIGEGAYDELEATVVALLDGGT